jgi:hypothetical protein
VTPDFSVCICFPVNVVWVCCYSDGFSDDAEVISVVVRYDFRVVKFSKMFDLRT